MLVDISTFPVNLYRSIPMPQPKIISGKAGTLSQKKGPARAPDQLPLSHCPSTHHARRTENGVCLSQSSTLTRIFRL